MLKMLGCIGLLLLGTSSFAQKTIHDPNVEVRTVSGSFHTIAVSGGIDLYLSKGEEAVAVSANDARFRAEIITEVKDGVLSIRYEWKNFKNMKNNSHKALRAYVSYKVLRELIASGGAEIHVADEISGDALKLILSGGADFSGKVAMKDLQIVASGGSDVEIDGTTINLSIATSGGSDVSGYGLVSEICNIAASGGSDVEITANKEISAEASGASDVSWKGGATVKRAKASGAGSVSHRS